MVYNVFPESKAGSNGINLTTWNCKLANGEHELEARVVIAELEQNFLVQMHLQAVTTCSVYINR
jgi:hypothetical protein